MSELSDFVAKKSWNEIGFWLTVPQICLCAERPVPSPIDINLLFNFLGVTLRPPSTRVSQPPFSLNDVCNTLILNTPSTCVSSVAGLDWCDLSHCDNPEPRKKKREEKRTRPVRHHRAWTLFSEYYGGGWDHAGRHFKLLLVFIFSFEKSLGMNMNPMDEYPEINLFQSFQKWHYFQCHFFFWLFIITNETCKGHIFAWYGYLIKIQDFLCLGGHNITVKSHSVVDFL